MKKVVVLNGSPRDNGNTAILVDSFVKGASENCEVEVISAAKLNISPCKGCNVCFTRDDKTCCVRDDMDMVMEKLMSADVLIIASPVYFYSISAQLKILIDRLHAPVRNSFSIRKMGLILDGEGKDISVFDSILAMYNAVADWFHLETVGMVFVNGVRNPGDVQNQADKLEEAYQLGKKVSAD